MLVAPPTERRPRWASTTRGGRADGPTSDRAGDRAGRRAAAELGAPVPRLRQAAVRHPRHTPRMAGTVSEPSASCGTCSPTSSAASGNRRSRRRSRAEPEAEPTFHEFATAWLRDGEPGWRPRTVRDYRWALELAPAPVVRPAPALRDHGRGGRSLQGGEAPRGAARAERDQQDPDPAGAGARGRRRVRAPRPQPGEGQAAPGEGDRAAAELGRARAAPVPARRRRPLHAADHRGDGGRRPAGRRGDGARLARREARHRDADRARVKDGRRRGARGRSAGRAPRGAGDLASAEPADPAQRSGVREPGARRRATPARRRATYRRGSGPRSWRRTRSWPRTASSRSGR